MTPLDRAQSFGEWEQRIRDAIAQLAAAKRERRRSCSDRTIRERVYRLMDETPTDVDSRKMLIASMLNVILWLGLRLSYEDRATLAAEIYGTADQIGAPGGRRDGW